jgi:hypothetical protein
MRVTVSKTAALAFGGRAEKINKNGASIRRRPDSVPGMCRATSCVSPKPCEGCKHVYVDIRQTSGRRLVALARSRGVAGRAADL